MTTNEVATMPNYMTLACEIILYAYNDYIRDNLDLYCLAHPHKGKHTEERYRKVLLHMDANLRWQYRRFRETGDQSVLNKFRRRERELFPKLLQSDIMVCRNFFLENPLIESMELNGERILAQADRTIQRWIDGEKIHLKKSCRGLAFEEDEDE